MFDSEQYELLDFGGGRKLERFGEVILDRPSPAAEGARKSNAVDWSRAKAKYRRTKGESGIWQNKSKLPDSWQIEHGRMTLELRPTPFGHLGIFPEQAANWDWIEKHVRRHGEQPKVLNLFAYTGGSTLAAAAAGAEVIHVDSAKNIVAWARRNAELSGMGEASIRWITEDAMTFAKRELRRGNKYDGVVLDPPTYGHGPQGEIWKINQDLSRLLQICAELTRSQLAFILLTCHSPGFGDAELEALLADTMFGSCQAGATARPLLLRSPDERLLHAGIAARWPN